MSCAPCCCVDNSCAICVAKSEACNNAASAKDMLHFALTRLLHSDQTASCAMQLVDVLIASEIQVGPSVQSAAAVATSENDAMSKQEIKQILKENGQLSLANQQWQEFWECQSERWQAEIADFVAVEAEVKRYLKEADVEKEAKLELDDKDALQSANPSSSYTLATLQSEIDRLTEALASTKSQLVELERFRSALVAEAAASKALFQLERKQREKSHEELDELYTQLKDFHSQRQHEAPPQSPPPLHPRPSALPSQAPPLPPQPQSWRRWFLSPKPAKEQVKKAKK